MAWKNLTLPEIIEQVDRNDLPTQDDKDELLKYLKRCRDLQKYLYAVQEARQFLPPECL